jgi:hypothetical protein
MWLGKNAKHYEKGTSEQSFLGIIIKVLDDLMAKDSTTESCGANVTMDIYLPKCSGMTLQARICDNMEETKGNQ